LDFKQAFDKVHHHSLWQALSKQGVPSKDTRLLAWLYSSQPARVKLDKLSREIPILRGVRQGDPISPFLFNAALEEGLRKCKLKWTEKGYGMEVGHPSGDKLTNLRFADDVVLTAKTLPQLIAMIDDLAAEAGRLGLERTLGKPRSYRT
jgi:hypothetical protein